MHLKPLIRHKPFALLIAALLLLSNALVTAHAFGEVDHAVKDGCQILHQIERQPVVAPTAPVACIAANRYERPVSPIPAVVAAETPDYFHSRAPPLA